MLKFSNFSWIGGAHEIYENLNPTEITNHTVHTYIRTYIRLCMVKLKCHSFSYFKLLQTGLKML